MDLDDDAKWLEWVAEQFKTIAGEDQEIDLEEFKTALKVKEASFAGGGGSQSGERAGVLRQPCRRQPRGFASCARTF